MTTFTTEDRLAIEPIPFAGMVDLNQDTRLLEQGTHEWKLARLGHVSGSSVADVMAKGKSGEAITRKKYKTRLVAERLTNEVSESYTNASMEWGVATEPMARQAYEVSHETFVDKTGFWKHPTIKWLGCSPDGLVGDDGLVEIKCPNTTTHIDYLWADEVPSEYYKQIQCQLWVTGRQWCDFVSYDPRLPKKNQLFVKRCNRDETLIATMEVEVLAFLGEVEVMINILSGAK
jgi:putative phage-type endonuclease